MCPGVFELTRFRAASAAGTSCLRSASSSATATQCRAARSGRVAACGRVRQQTQQTVDLATRQQELAQAPGGFVVVGVHLERLLERAHGCVDVTALAGKLGGFAE